MDGTQLPTIKLVWDAEQQVVRVEFQPEEFKTWDFVLAVIEMGKKTAEFKQRVGQMANVQQHQAAQQQAAMRAAQQAAQVKKQLLQVGR